MALKKQKRYGDGDYRGVAQFGRALRSGRRGRKFESCRLDFLYFTENAGIAQQVEHFTRNEGVVSSNLISSLLQKEPWSLRFFFYVHGRECV